MSDLYRRSTEFPFHDKETLWDAFRIAAAFEWAKGRPPSAEAIADAMVKVLVPVKPRKVATFCDVCLSLLDEQWPDESGCWHCGAMTTFRGTIVEAVDE